MGDTLTIDDLKRLEQLQNEVNAMREQLKPKYEAIQKKTQDLQIVDDLLFLLEFEGKPSFKTEVEWLGKKYEVVFKPKKIG